MKTYFGVFFWTSRAIYLWSCMTIYTMETSNWFTSTNWNVHVLNLKWLRMLHPTHCISSPKKSTWGPSLFVSLPHHLCVEGDLTLLYSEKKKKKNMQHIKMTKSLLTKTNGTCSCNFQTKKTKRFSATFPLLAFKANLKPSRFEWLLLFDTCFKHEVTSTQSVKYHALNKNKCTP